LERKGYLKASRQAVGAGCAACTARPWRGRKALEAAKMKVQELFGELFEE